MLEKSLDEIRDVIETYPYVAIETQFPGIVARPVAHKEYQYRSMKVNVDLVNIIQMAFRLTNGRGEAPRLQGTWQFNFSFTLRYQPPFPNRDSLLEVEIYTFAKS